MCVAENGFGNVVLLLFFAFAFSFLSRLSPIFFQAVRSLMGQVNTIFVDTQWYVKFVLFIGQQRRRRRH